MLVAHVIDLFFKRVRVRRLGMPFVVALNTVGEAIDRADPEELRRLMDHAAQTLAGAAGPAELRTLRTQMDRYDYEKALETIRRIRGAMEGYP